MKTIYFVNNYSGVHVPGLKDSVYILREKLNSNGLVLEEKNFFIRLFSKREIYGR